MLGTGNDIGTGTGTGIRDQLEDGLYIYLYV